MTLDWTDVANATSYEVPVSDSSMFSAPFVANPTVTASQATLSGLPAQQLWWRVRAPMRRDVRAVLVDAALHAAGAARDGKLGGVTVNPSSVGGPGRGDGRGDVDERGAGRRRGGRTLSPSNTGAASRTATVGGGGQGRRPPRSR